jgi:hypothetical protein
MNAYGGVNTTPASAGTQTRKQKSFLMTLFLLDFERVTGQRVTVELIRSPQWKAMRAAFVNIFLPLMQEKGKTK